MVKSSHPRLFWNHTPPQPLGNSMFAHSKLQRSDPIRATVSEDSKQWRNSFFTEVLSELNRGCGRRHVWLLSYPFHVTFNRHTEPTCGRRLSNAGHKKDAAGIYPAPKSRRSQIYHFLGNLLSMFQGIFTWDCPSSVIFKFPNVFSHESIQKGLWNKGRKDLEVHKLKASYLLLGILGFHGSQWGITL